MKMCQTQLQLWKKKSHYKSDLFNQLKLQFSAIIYSCCIATFQDNHLLSLICNVFLMICNSLEILDTPRLLERFELDYKVR